VGLGSLLPGSSLVERGFNEVQLDRRRSAISVEHLEAHFLVRQWLATGVNDHDQHQAIDIALEGWLREKPRRFREPAPDDSVSGNGVDFSPVETTIERRKANLRSVDKEALLTQEERVVAELGHEIEVEAIRFVLRRRAEGGNRCLPRDIAWDTKKKGFQRLYTQQVNRVLDVAEGVQTDSEEDIVSAAGSVSDAQP